MRKRFRQAVSLFLAAVLVLPSCIAPIGSVHAEEVQEVKEVKTGFAFEKAEQSFHEDVGKQTIQIQRTGGSTGAGSVTVSSYNFSAEYGKDYQIIVDGVALKSGGGTTSLFHQFRDNPYIGVKDDTDSAMVEGLLAMSAMAEENEEVLLSEEEAKEQSGGTSGTTAQMLELMKELQVKAVQWTIDFAEGQESAQVEVEILEDSEAEYGEQFFLVLESEDSIGEQDLISCTISDNEETAPTNSIAFAQAELETDAETGVAELYFERTGDLATFSKIVLCKDGEPYGYVMFNPYQEEQMVEAEAGIYQIANPESCQAAEPMTAVVRAAEVQSEMTSAEDEEGLDTVPTYSAVEISSTPMLAFSYASWYPEWAKTTGTTETEDYITYVGSTGSDLFGEGGTDGNGEATYKSSSNEWDLSTSGTGSRVGTGYVYLDSKKVDLTGIASVTGAFDVSGLDFDAQVKIGVHSINSYWKWVENDSSGEISCEIKTPTRVKEYIYYENIDPTVTDDGCSVWVPNAFKLNKREYLIIVDDPEPLSYYDAEYGASIAADTRYVVKKMGSGKTDKSRIQIVYESPAGRPQKLVGYKIVKEGSGTETGTISLNGASTISFTNAFLKSYEETYSFKTTYNGKEYYAFKIVPVFEKEEVESYSLEESKLGTIKITSPSNGKLYKGDRVIFEADTSEEGVSLSGVRIYGKRSSNTIWESGVKNISSDGKVYYTLSANCDEYRFQPVYESDSDVLTVEYAEGAKDHGQLAAEDGIVVKKDEYIVNDYVPLIAKPNSGYVTKWTSNGRIYYGDTFFYQLDGVSENNAFTVDFVSTSEVTCTSTELTGTISKRVGNLAGGTIAITPMANAKFTITADKVYEGTTDKNGKFAVSGFTGVAGGKYSMVIEDGSFFQYGYFTYTGTSGVTYDVELPQYGASSFYPRAATISVEGQDAERGKIELDSVSYIDTTIEVYNAVNSPYTVTGVELIYYGTGDDGGLVEKARRTITTKDEDAQETGLYSYYKDSVLASTLPVDTKVYVNVLAVREGNTEATLSSGEIYTGYDLISDIYDDSIPIFQDIPDVPGVQSAYSINLSDLDVPILGVFDFGITGKNGGYFVRQADVNDPNVFYLVAGFSVSSVYLVGSPGQKMDVAKDMYKKMDEAEANGNQVGDTRNTTVGVAAQPTAQDGQTEAGQKKNPSKAEGYELKKIFAIYPAVMLKWGFENVTIKNGEEEIIESKLKSLDAAFGIDANVYLTKPFTIYGVPFYVTFSMNSEAYFLFGAGFNAEETNSSVEDDKTNVVYDEMLGETEDGLSSILLCVPYAHVGLKGGVGLMNFLDLYLTLDFNVQTYSELMSAEEGLDAAFAIEYSGGVGGDLLILALDFSLTGPPIAFGNQNLLEELGTVTDLIATGDSIVSSASLRSAPLTEDVKITMIERPNSSGVLFRASGVTMGTLSEHAFKGTQIKLIELGDGSIMALLLADNGAPEGDANYLSVAYTISADGGNTWGEVKHASESEHLQFDVEVFELRDKLLITWSEGDADEVLSKLDKENIRAADVAKMLNAMNLKGRYFDKTTGEPLGEAFTIAEDTGVAMSVLDVVEDAGGNVHAYYQRSAYTTDENATFQDLIGQERTLAHAVLEANGNEWVSYKVAAGNADKTKSYRVTEVVPFSHKGITGEVLVLDLDGRLVTGSGEDLSPSIEDRQIYIRFYSNEDGTETTAIIPVTEPDVCAQNVQVVSNGDELYLFWNQEGEIVYLSDFAVTKEEYDEKTSQALAVVDVEKNEVSVLEQKEEIGSMEAADHQWLHNGSQYSVSMSDGGDVLLSFIAEENHEGHSVTEQIADIYGVILKTVENDGVRRLEAVGSPVALTDENSLLRKMDSVCLSSESFLVAYTKLDGVNLRESKKASVHAVQSSYVSEASVVSVDAPDYPTVGEEMIVDVTVRNDGLKPIEKGTAVTVSGIGDSVTVYLDEALLPGTEETLHINVSVPKDFHADASLTAAFMDSSQSDMVYYDSYFVPVQMAYLNNVPNTDTYLSDLEVINIGNAPGKPVVEYHNFVVGSEDEEDVRVTIYSDTEEVAPGGQAHIKYLIEDTLAYEADGTRMQIVLGDGYDQSVEGVLPAAVTHTETSSSGQSSEIPGGSDESGGDAESGGAENGADTGDTANIVMYAGMLTCAGAVAVMTVVERKKRGF